MKTPLGTEVDLVADTNISTLFGHYRLIHVCFLKIITYEFDCNVQCCIANDCSAVAEMGDRGHNRHGPKRGGCCAQLGRAAGSPSNTMSPRLRPNPVPSSTVCHNTDGPKIGGGALPPVWGGDLGPHLAQCGVGRGPPPCQVTILIDPAIWSQ